jgi:hypothetical protein
MHNRQGILVLTALCAAVLSLGLAACSSPVVVAGPPDPTTSTTAESTDDGTDSDGGGAPALSTPGPGYGSDEELATFCSDFPQNYLAMQNAAIAASDSGSFAEVGSLSTASRSIVEAGSLVVSSPDYPLFAIAHYAFLDAVDASVAASDTVGLLSAMTDTTSIDKVTPICTGQPGW